MSNILEELEKTELGLERHYFLADHRREIMRAVALKEFPKRPAWNPEDRWPWLKWGQGTPPPPPLTVASARTVIEAFDSLPFAERHQLFRRYKDRILEAWKFLREA